MSLIEEEARDQIEDPYKGKQYDFIKKHFTKGSAALNLYKTELALRLRSFVALMMSSRL